MVKGWIRESYGKGVGQREAYGKAKGFGQVRQDAA